MKARQRQRGDGSVYLRGDKYWVKYYYNGKAHFEATGAQADCGPAVFQSENERHAWTYLTNVKKKVGAAQLGHTNYVGATAQKILMTELYDIVTTHYEAKCAKDGKEISDHALYSGVKRAKIWFGAMKAIDLTQEFWDTWMVKTLPTLRETYQPATINRALAYTRRALRLGVERKKLSGMPSNVSAVMLLKEEKLNVRKGFFEYSEYQALMKAEADIGLKDYYTFGYLTGWRSGSIKKLKWETVDMKARMFVSRERDQKSGQKNVMPLGKDGEPLFELIKRRWARRTYQREGVTVISEYVFHRDGDPIGDIRKSWAATCRAAGLMKPKLDRKGSIVTTTIDGKAQRVMIPSKLFHDFRRTAARDIYHATKDKDVAKSVTGHLTDAMFDRYNIITDTQKSEAIAERMKKVTQGT